MAEGKTEEKVEAEEKVDVVGDKTEAEEPKQEENPQEAKESEIKKDEL